MASKREQYTADKFVSLFGELVKRDLRLKYRRSVLGYFWSLLNPLMMMTVMMVVFSYMFRFEIENYPLYLICGQTMFNFFNESTTRAMFSIIDNGILLKKVYVPKYVFPISKVLSCFVTMSFSLLAILIVMVVTRVQFHLTILLFWVPMLYLLVFCCGMALVLSAMSVRFRDVTHLYSVLVMAWMYATPVFYPIEAVPGTIHTPQSDVRVYCIVPGTAALRQDPRSGNVADRRGDGPDDARRGDIGFQEYAGQLYLLHLMIRS